MPEHYRRTWYLSLTLLLTACAGQDERPAEVASVSELAATPVVAPADPSPANIDARPFPREFDVGGRQFQVHQPQYDSWQGDRLEGRFVMAVKTGSHADASGKTVDQFDFGVVRFEARTQVDKDARAVVLTDLTLVSASFPTALEQQAAYLQLANQQLDRTSTLTVSLDQLESAIAIARVDSATSRSHPVDNTPPDIIFSTEPALLMLVDGQPELRDAGVAGVQRVINTHSLLLLSNARYYTSVAEHWFSAPTLDGPWTAAGQVSSALDRAAATAREQQQVATLDNPPKALSDAMAAGHMPAIFVRTHPAELISVDGEPQFAAIPGTSLSYISNTGADVFVDGSGEHSWYLLVSGRWFTAPSSQGPWAFLAPRNLPGDFTSIPPDSVKSGVLASIPGTPEAREALIANQVPQTAAVHPTQASLQVQYDGAPQFTPIEGTSLQYARNTAVPVIRVAEGSYYAVDKGVWFASNTASGPWAVARSVPAVIYSIPVTSPLHYVTYVRVYGSDGDVVYVGYTPGYYGTVVSDDVVVYGSGYGCDPWVGAYWYGCPATYGLGVYFGWNPWVGWSFGFGFGWYAGWYGPWAPWWGPWWGPAYPWGWWGGGAAAWNVYGHWGNAAVRGTAAAWANPWTGNYGRGARGGYYNERTGGSGIGRAGVNTNVYTGTTVAGAQGIRYNPQTGRVVAGGGAAAVNPYTGQAAAAGRRTTVNTDTGRVTNSAGGVVAGDQGAAGAGGFHTEGPGGGSAAGAGGFHYNADTGTFDHGGVARINDNYYAGRDGNVYRYNDGQWQPVERPERNQQIGGQTQWQRPDNLDTDRLARERGNQRIEANGLGGARGYNRPVGGYRGGLGGRPMGGFGGGFRRR